MRMPATTSGKKSASAVITTVGGYVVGIDVISPSKGVSLIRVYDSPVATTDITKIVAEIQADAGFVNMNHEYVHPVASNSGIYVELDQTDSTTADASYILRYAIGT